MESLDVISDLERTGYAEVLKEQSINRPEFHEHHEPMISFTLPQTISLSHLEPSRYLNFEEQQVFSRALRRSVRIVHKAGSEA